MIGPHVPPQLDDDDPSIGPDGGRREQQPGAAPAEPPPRRWKDDPSIGPDGGKREQSR
jgi:hypothetical protein